VVWAGGQHTIVHGFSGGGVYDGVRFGGTASRGGVSEMSGGITVGPGVGHSLGERRRGIGLDAGSEQSKGSGSMTLGSGEGAWGVGVKPTLGGQARSGMGVKPTLGSAALAGGWTVVGFGGAGTAETLKMSTNCLMAFIWASPRATSGDAGAGFRIAQHRFMAARMAASAEESCGMLP
jgi:hypothetical protein